MLFYGATKVFGEHMGLFYKRKYGLDFRGIRYPSIVGPGVRTPGVVQYTSWVIEESIKGNPFAIWVEPETKCPLIYFKDAALAIIRLAEAPMANIKMVNYVIAGVTPVLSAQELADIVKARVPAAQIEFKPNPETQKIVGNLMWPIDDGIAREEWGWEFEYDQKRMVDDFINEMQAHPQRYT